MNTTDHITKLRGDETELYEQHADHLLASVRRVTYGDRAHVEDACQFAWMQLLRHQPPRDRVFAWLRTTAMRQVWVTTGRERREFAFHPERDTGGAADDTARIAARAALRTITSLPSYERRYLTLQAAGFTCHEIATLCTVTERHVSRYLSRGRRRARLRRQ